MKIIVFGRGGFLVKFFFSFLNFCQRKSNQFLIKFLLGYEGSMGP